MAVVLGTSAGFVTTAPTANPVGSGVTQLQGRSVVTRDTSPATAIKITEIGWWCDDASSEANFEMGLYAADGAGGIAGTRLYVDDTNAKGTTSGWKKITVDWDISSSTAYWLAVQLDDTERTDIDSESSGSFKGILYTQTTLNNPYGSYTAIAGFFAIYAVWEAAAPPPSGTGQYINIGDSLLQISELYINIGDNFKSISELYINIGDSWKSAIT